VGWARKFLLLRRWKVMSTSSWKTQTTPARAKRPRFEKRRAGALGLVRGGGMWALRRTTVNDSRSISFWRCITYLAVSDHNNLTGIAPRHFPSLVMQHACEYSPLHVQLERIRAPFSTRARRHFRYTPCPCPVTLPCPHASGQRLPTRSQSIYRSRAEALSRTGHRAR
jgi:hypothetical protein